MPEKSFISRKNYHSCLARHKNYSPLPLPAKLLLLQNFPRNFQEHKSLFFTQVSTKSSKHARPRERDEILVSAGEIWPIYTIYITRLSDNVSHFFCSDKKQQENRRRNLSLRLRVCVVMLGGQNSLRKREHVLNLTFSIAFLFGLQLISYSLTHRLHLQIAINIFYIEVCINLEFRTAH